MACYCAQHSEFCGNSNFKILKLNQKKVKVLTVKYLIENGLLKKRQNSICDVCVSYVEKNLVGKAGGVSASNFSTDDLLKLIKTSDDSTFQLICGEVGTRLSKEIYNDIKGDEQTYTDTSSVSIPAKEWLKERQAHLVKLLRCVTDYSGEHEKKDVCVASAISSLYKARKLNYVSSFSFSKNLVSYYICGSKTLLNLNNRLCAAGSYTTLKKWLLNLAQPLQKAPVGDLFTFFDNSQVISRNWRVNYNYRPTANVITTVCHIKQGTNYDIQTITQLSPKNWLYGSDDDTLRTNIISHVRHGERDFDGIRDMYILQQMANVKDIEEIDTTSMEKADADPYLWVPGNHPQTAPTLKVGEPVMQNPCSYSAVKSVLTHIETITDIGTSRQWTTVGCDGLPYTLAAKLQIQDETIRNMLLLPGLGHLEMNMVKAVFRLLWEPCLSHLAAMLGFKSLKAQTTCKACSDHHKSWQILTIFLYGTLNEILCDYLKNASTENPSVAGLYEYIGKCKNPNYRFMCDVTFNTVLPLFVFRGGVRKNNTQFINAGKCKFLKLFYGFNMWNYQYIIIQDLKTRILAPLEVRNFIETNETFSISGHDSKGEGGDFVLENINKKVMKLLPQGIPQERDWLNVCRNLDSITEIRDKVMNECGMKPTPNIYQRDLTTEITEWRRFLRDTRYLSTTENSNRLHVSVDGKSLDHQLISFESQCDRNFSTYLKSIFKDPKKRIHLEPIFTTTDERQHFHSIENKSKQQLVSIIQSTIDDVKTNGDVEEAYTLQKHWQKLKAGTKMEMIEFYKEVVTALQNSTTKDIDIDDTNDTDNDDDDIMDSF